jgi:serine/threonine-protein kinase
MPLRIGETFAGYRILRLLGSGGMGEVYLVQHPRLPRRDALKVLRPDVSSDASYRERFVREADLAAGLRHSHIVGIHDRGEYNSQLWIAMDYIEGTDAAQFMERRYPAGMPTDLVAHIVTAVASALDYAHKKGLLHRDVKPANMIVADIDTDDPSVFLADFGIARPLDDTSGITTTNMTVGTVAYAAPEQLMGESIDGRADQYALAATIYHLLTGLQLFPQSNPAVVISRHLNTTPPRLSDRRTDLAGLDAVLRSALAKNPDDRFSSCTAFARAFAEQVRPTGDAASPAAPTQFAPVPRDENTPTASPGQLHRPWQRRPVIVGAVVAALLLIGASVSIPLLTRSDRDTSAARTQSAEATTSSQDISISPSRTSIPPSTSVTASSGSFPTIVDYIQQNGIVETPVHRGDPGSPTINLPFPPGWADAGSRTPNWAYGAMLFSDPAMAADPPTVIALVSKLTGNVDAAEILMYAPNEIKNLPGYDGAEAGTPSTLGGFDATQIGGTYTKDGVRRAIAQKTVVIPGKGGLYVLQLNADGTEDQMGTLMDATSVIDQQTKITP